MRLKTKTIELLRDLGPGCVVRSGFPRVVHLAGARHVVHHVQRGYDQ